MPDWLLIIAVIAAVWALWLGWCAARDPGGDRDGDWFFGKEDHE